MLLRLLRRWLTTARAGLPIAFWLVIGFLFGGLVGVIFVRSIALLRDPALRSAPVIVVVVTVVALVVVLPPFLLMVRRVGFTLAELLIGLPPVRPASGPVASLFGALWYLQQMILGVVGCLFAAWIFPLGVSGLTLALGGTNVLEPMLGWKISRPVGLAMALGAIAAILAAPWCLRQVDRWLRFTAQFLIVGERLDDAPSTERRLITFREAAVSSAILDALTHREREVLTLLIEGKTNPQIAKTLFITSETVKSHVSAVLAKLGVDNRTQAAALAISAGLG